MPQENLLWPKGLFHNIVDVATYNTFVLSRELNPFMPDKRNRHRFLLERVARPVIFPLLRARCGGG